MTIGVLWGAINFSASTAAYITYLQLRCLWYIIAKVNASSKCGSIYNMSFGFSAGDIFAVGKLICAILQTLQDVGGAKSHY